MREREEEKRTSSSASETEEALWSDCEALTSMALTTRKITPTEDPSARVTGFTVGKNFSHEVWRWMTGVSAPSKTVTGRMPSRRLIATERREGV
jgi:hypothetical protein